MLFFMEDMTPEFAVVTMQHKCCGCLAIPTTLCAKARTR